MHAIAVFDIGKTNVKLSLLDEDGRLLEVQRRANQVVHDGPYPHVDVDGIWNWLLQVLREAAGRFDIRAIVPVAHGATAALVDEDGLVLPILDYESLLPQQSAAAVAAYAAIRPGFDVTLSPALPAGLNLGRQIHWLATAYPHAFAKAVTILPYPQYWAWRLSGVAATEVTSLGCHTDMWEPLAQRYSTLVREAGWQALMPPMREAGDVLGTLSDEVVRATGLRAECRVHCGIHDSNASLLRYLRNRDHSSARTILSTGTWVIAACLDAPLSVLDEHADMLANVDVDGRPVPSMRYMGGREFSTLAGKDHAPCAMRELQALIDQETFAIPAFADSGGPFAGKTGRVVGPAPANARERYALATLYSVLMTDYCLTALESTGPIAVEGSFTANPCFAGLLALARPGQPVRLSDDASGSVQGAWALASPERTVHWAQEPVVPLQLHGWERYAANWNKLLDIPRDSHRRDPAESAV